MKRIVPFATLLRVIAVAAVGLVIFTSMGCKSVSRFSTHDGDHFEGDVVKGSFVRAGVAEDAKMCLRLDAAHLQDAPGTFSTSDGRFKDALLRPIPQVWHDPLSTMSFGEGRSQNLVYVASPTATVTATSVPGDAQDVMVFLSLMEEGGLEVRLVRGAPGADSGTPLPAAAPPMFGVFTLDRRDGACSF
jgi:hypothetical protein